MLSDSIYGLGPSFPLKHLFYLRKRVPLLHTTVLILCDEGVVGFVGVLRIVCLFVFVALRPMSTAMVIAGRSVPLTTLFPGQA